VVKIKICGITSVADALEATRLGVDALGLNFYPSSPRYLHEQQARAIVQELPAFLDPVGLFVNETPENVGNVMSRLGLRTCQWHGDQEQTFPGHSFRAILAFSIRGPESLQKISSYLTSCRGKNFQPAAILVDAHVPGLHGGTGQIAPWELLAEFKPEVPLILAGGLTPDNVAEAIRRVRPYAVDVASGVESSPGKKDWDKMKRFVDQVRQVDG
jgi:phosphoribosylanthranilate isomerase